jgi:hypothetical protein
VDLRREALNQEVDGGVNRFQLDHMVVVENNNQLFPLDQLIDQRSQDGFGWRWLWRTGGDGDGLAEIWPDSLDCRNEIRQKAVNLVVVFIQR